MCLHAGVFVTIKSRDRRNPVQRSFFVSVSFAGPRSREQWGESQVGIPNLGSTHLFRTNHIATIARKIARDPMGLPLLSAGASIFYEKARSEGRGAIIDRDGDPSLDVLLHVIVEKHPDLIARDDEIARIFRLIQSQSQAGTASADAGEDDAKGRALEAGALHDSRELVFCGFGDMQAHVVYP